MCQQWKWRINHANQSQYYANVFAGRVLRDPCVPTLDQRWNTESAAKCGAYWYKRHTLYLHGATFHRNIALFQPAAIVKILLAHHRYSVYNPINQTGNVSRAKLFCAKKHKYVVQKKSLFKKSRYVFFLFYQGKYGMQTGVFAAFRQLSSAFHRPRPNLFLFWAFPVKWREMILNVQTTRGIWIFEDVCSDKSLIVEWR